MAGAGGDRGRFSHALWSGPPWRATVVIWVTIFLFVALTTGGGFGSASLRAYRLARGGQKIAGTVTAIEPSKHDGCRYTYEVDGATYSRSEEGCGEGRRVGTGLTVTYLPSNPGVATAGDARRQWRDDLLFAFLAPTLLAGFFYATRRRRSTPGRVLSLRRGAGPSDNA